MNTRYAIAAGLVMLCAPVVSADTFGTGANQFTIDFVPIAGDEGNLGSWAAGSYYTFTGANRSDYRMGTFEITNDQWDKFKASLGLPVTGNPLDAYDEESDWTGSNVPTNNVSWYEAAQFVNWLNTSTGHQAAYKFTGTQGTGGYALDTWSAAEAAGGTNLYRHKDAMYYMPTEGEWVKAAYWNGTSLQTYATKPGDTVHLGDGVSGTGWNYYDYYDGYATTPPGPWDVGSGSEELNGTYDMMGNVWEWMESPYFSNDYGTGSFRGLRGGSYYNLGYFGITLASSRRDYYGIPDDGGGLIGFRVASEVPEPASLWLLSLGSLALLRRRRLRPVIAACSVVVLLLAILAVSPAAQAVNIETVPVGNPGNTGEVSGEGADGAGYGVDRVCGAVAYEYRIGKYEVTAGQYTEFLNAVAKTDTYGLYNELMGWGSCRIKRSGSPGSYTYSVAPDWANRPVHAASWERKGEKSGHH